MRRTFKKSNPQTSRGTRNATSSRESACGVTPLERLDGQTILPFGQAPAPARVSVQAGRGGASTIHVTYGPHGSGSYASAALTQSLASKLRPKTDLLGSMLFRLIWKERITPSGRRICALRASGLRTSGQDFTSWRSPTRERRPSDQLGRESRPSDAGDVTAPSAPCRVADADRRRCGSRREQTQEWGFSILDADSELGDSPRRGLGVCGSAPGSGGRADQPVRV